MKTLTERMKDKILIFDGAMGTLLQASGLQTGECPERWNLAYPEKVTAVYEAYLKAGSDLILTNTFGGSRLKLGEYGLADSTYEINAASARLARRAADSYGALAVGTVGPCGQYVFPYGPYSFSEVAASFREQIRGLLAGGAQIIHIETMADLAEMRAALIVCRELTDLPVIAQMTFADQGRTVLGTDPITAVTVMEALGADVVGANCSGGPEELLPVMTAMAKTASRPLVVKPNAGLPTLVAGETVFPATPEDMARHSLVFAEMGVRIIGGCCGNTPAHIRAMAVALQNVKPRVLENRPVGRISSRTKTIRVEEPDLPIIIGERINPTGKKKLADSLRNGDMDPLRQLAKQQESQGAAILDVNVGAAGIDEEKVLLQAVQSISGVVNCPLALDTTDIAALEAALKIYPGKALINSVTGEEEKLNLILPLAKRYGAAVIGLTMDEAGIPSDAQHRLAIGRKIVEHALCNGIPKEDVYLDCLVMTAAAQPEAVVETLKAIRLIREELGVRTVLGISNVSHGLPERDRLNAVYLSAALANGLDMVIADPGSLRIQETAAAWKVISGQDRGAGEFIRRYSQTELKTDPTVRLMDPSPVQYLRQAILDGDREGAIRGAERCVEKGQAPMEVINRVMIPALETVGELYEQGTYFLPQLLMAAEAAEGAFLLLREDMDDKADAKRGTVVLATVKGDIHDIGKNIVSILLQNHGYRVVDLGKDVPKEMIEAAARNEQADIIGLSALMTTTMLEMERTIAFLKQQNTDSLIIVGGAVVTPDFADAVGADAVGIDAQDAVRKVSRLMEQRRGYSDHR